MPQTRHRQIEVLVNSRKTSMTHNWIHIAIAIASTPAPILSLDLLLIDPSHQACYFPSNSSPSSPLHTRGLTLSSKTLGSQTMHTTRSVPVGPPRLHPFLLLTFTDVDHKVCRIKGTDWWREFGQKCRYVDDDGRKNVGYE